MPEGQEERLFADIDPERLPREFHGKARRAGVAFDAAASSSTAAAVTSPSSAGSFNSASSPRSAKPLEGDMFLLDAAFRYERDSLLPKSGNSDLTALLKASRRAAAAAKAGSGSAQLLVRAMSARGGCEVLVKPEDGAAVVAIARGRMELAVEHVVAEGSAAAQPARIGNEVTGTAFTRVAWPVQGFAAANQIELLLDYSEDEDSEDEADTLDSATPTRGDGPRTPNGTSSSRAPSKVARQLPSHTPAPRAKARSKKPSSVSFTEEQGACSTAGG